MLRAIKEITLGLISLVLVLITSPLLFWLGREENPKEVFMDLDNLVELSDTDDLGEDVDDYR